MLNRYPERALRIVLVCLAILASSGAAAQAGETAPEVLVPAQEAESAAAAPASEAAAHAAPTPAKDWLSTAMNAGAVAFCIWMVALLWRPGLGRSLRKPV